MLSSQNYIREEGVLRVGEAIASDLDLSDPAIKTYYHQTPGASTHLPDGAAVVFRGGQFSTKNPEIIAFLDKIADKQGTMVFTRSNKHVVQELRAAALSAAKPAGDAASDEVDESKLELKAAIGTDNGLEKPAVEKTVEIKPVKLKL